MQKLTKKWIKHLNVRPKTIKLLAENIPGKASLGFVIFLDMTPKA